MHQPSIIKILSRVLLATAACFLGACNKLDPGLIESAQTRLSKVQESRPELEQGLQNTAQLLEQIQKAPAGLGKNPEFGVPELTTSLEILKSEYKKLQEKHDSLYSSLDGLVGNYIDGQIKKKKVEEGMSSFDNTMTGLQKKRNALAVQFNEYSTKYARMSTAFAALPPPEQAALNNVYDGLPDTLPKPAFRPAVKKPVVTTPENTPESIPQQQ
ncbi:MAG: hypothetical protein R3D58_00650 [Saprospiraceae bacterium]